MLVGLIHFALTFYMIGLIMVIQFVHYPTFHYVNSERFKEFSIFHQSKMGLIVAPVMICEFITSGVLLFLYPLDLAIVLNFFFLIFIWIQTFFISVPRHQCLNRGRDQIMIKSLIQWNWLRTFFWIVRGGLVFIIIY